MIEIKHDNSLSFSGQKIDRIPPMEEEKAIKVEKLDLSDNYLRGVSGIEKFVNTTSVVLDSNQLESISDIYELKYLKKLASASFIDNEIRRIDGYRMILISLFPQLLALDGVPILKV